MYQLAVVVVTLWCVSAYLQWEFLREMFVSKSPLYRLYFRGTADILHTVPILCDFTFSQRYLQNYCPSGHEFTSIWEESATFIS